MGWKRPRESGTTPPAAMPGTLGPAPRSWSDTRIYAALGISRLMPTPGVCRVVWVGAGDAGGRGRARGIIRVVVGGSEVVEEGQHGVRRSVTSGRCAGPGEAVEGLLLEGEIGVQVDHR